MQIEPTDDELARRSAIKLALRARWALARRERWLEQAIASNRDEAQDWWMKAMRLLRAIQAADQAYERELGEALERHRKLITTGIEDNDDDAPHAP